MLPSAWHDLSPFITDWGFEDALGYYVHDGFVYLDGRIFSWAGSPAVTGQIFAGLPAAIRPAADRAVTLIADYSGTDWTQDLAVQLPLSYAATMHPDGTFTLNDPVPPQLNTTPSAGTYWYIDGGSVHHARYSAPLTLTLTLGGARWRLQTVIDSVVGTSLAGYLGADFTDIDATYAPHNERVHLGGRVSVTSDGATELLTSVPADAQAGLGSTDFHDTVVQGPDRPYGLTVYGPGFCGLLEDSSIKAASDPPPLSWSCPPGNPLGHDYVDGTHFTIPAGFGGIPTGFYPGMQIFADHIDHGLYSCPGATCRTPGGVPTYTFDIDALVAMCDPVPPWFFLQLTYSVNLRAFANDGTCTIGGDCGPDVPVGLSAAISASAPLGGLKLPDGSPAATGGSDASGWVAPGTPLYTGPTSLGFLGGSYPSNQPQLVWKHGQITGSFTITPTAQVNVADVTSILQIYPLYEMRQAGLHAGDVLRLDGAGWVGVTPDPVRTSFMRVGPGLSGHIMLPQS